jgi:hypothetical protein
VIPAKRTSRIPSGGGRCGWGEKFFQASEQLVGMAD